MNWYKKAQKKEGPPLLKLEDGELLVYLDGLRRFLEGYGVSIEAIVDVSRAGLSVECGSYNLDGITDQITWDALTEELEENDYIRSAWEENGAFLDLTFTQPIQVIRGEKELEDARAELQETWKRQEDSERAWDDMSQFTSYLSDNLPKDRPSNL